MAGRFSVNLRFIFGNEKLPDSADDLQGLIAVVVQTAASSSSNWQGDVSHLSSGTYFIEVINNSDSSVVGKNTFVKY